MFVCMNAGVHMYIYIKIDIYIYIHTSNAEPHTEHCVDVSQAPPRVGRRHFDETLAPWRLNALLLRRAMRLLERKPSFKTAPAAPRPSKINA